MIFESQNEDTLLNHAIFAFDLETTGLDPAEDRIVQVGGVYLKRGKRLGPRRSSLVNPGIPIPPDATEIHGITDEMVRDRPRFDAVGGRFAACTLRGPDMEAPILCGYNAPGFDVPFINAELRRHGIAHEMDPAEVLDPLVFVRWHHRDWRTRTLEEAARRYGFEMRNAHSAADDAEATAVLLWRMLEKGLIPSNPKHALAEQKRLAAKLENEWERFGYALYLDREDERPRMGFGTHIGELLECVDREYLRWCLKEMEELTDEARGLMGVVA